MANHYAAPQSDVSDVNNAASGGLTSNMINAMRGTKPWVLLIGIVMIIGAVFLVFGTIGVFFAATVGMATAGPQGGMFMGIGAMYALMSIIYIALAVYLLKYSSAIGRLLHSTNAIDMEDALDSQRKFWKLAGILTLVMIVVSVLGFLAAIIIPIMSRVGG